MKLRIKFAKYGAVKFIGHLDMMRYFQKSIRRSGIDIAYSEGYSPHQIMSFAQPLGVGLESQGEYLDIEVKAYTSSQQMKEQLQKTMAEGIEIKSIRQLPEKIGNAMASVAAAKYEVTFRTGYEPSFDWKTEILKFYKEEVITVIKQTKKSEKEMDLKPSIFELYLSKTIDDKDTIHMLVDASSAGNIKPSLVMNAFFTRQDTTLPEFALEVTRLDTYGKNENDGVIEYLPLEEFGNEFNEQ